MANAGVEVGAKMLGVDTGAPTALAASAIRLTIAATEIAFTAALNPKRWGRSTAIRGASSTARVALLTCASSKPLPTSSLDIFRPMAPGASPVGRATARRSGSSRPRGPYRGGHRSTAGWRGPRLTWFGPEKVVAGLQAPRNNSPAHPDSAHSRSLPRPPRL